MAKKAAKKSAAGGAVMTVSAADARALLMEAQALLEDPAGSCDAARVYQLIRRMGFVQLDTITTVERAHHHILHSRLDEYEPAHLHALHHEQRLLFEQITHDASLIPTEWFSHWRYRYDRARFNRWLNSKIGDRAEEELARVRAHVREKGACMSRDLAPERNGTSGGAGGWWEWKPHKAALEYLWRTGELVITAREGFNKVFDLTERALPEAHALPTPAEEEHVEWACRSALERLGVATSGELAAFWRLVKPAQAAAWCRGAAGRGEIVPVKVEAADGSRARGAFAPADIGARLARVREAPSRVRLLSPFDPVIRDRTRLMRLFNFDYRFEAFVPAPKRKYGYYVLPILEGDRFIGRLDPKLHRERGGGGVLEIKRVWWERGVERDGARVRAVRDGIERFAAFLGATDWKGPRELRRVRP